MKVKISKIIFIFIGVIIGIVVVWGLTRNIEETPKTEPVAIKVVEEKFEFIQPALGADTTGYSKEDKESWRMKSEQISEQYDKIRKNTLTSCQTAMNFYWQVEENLDLLQSNEAKWEKILAQGDALKEACDADYLKYGGK